MISIDFESNVSEALEAIEHGVNEHVIRSTAHAGAMVFYEEAKLRAPVYDGPMPKILKNGVEVKPGQLRDAIYRKFSEERSGEDNKVYHVSWNHVKAPHGYWYENGYWVTTVAKNGKKRLRFYPPKSFIRSSFDRAQDSVSAMQARAAEKTQEVLQEIASQYW